MRDVATQGAYRNQGSMVALAVEQERRRMADELHDSVVQQLALACILIDQARLEQPNNHLDRARSLLDESLVQLRSMVVARRPAVLHQAGLYQAIEWLAEHLGQRWGLAYDARVVGDPAVLPNTITEALFLSARELMTNVGRHAHASRCEVVVAVGDTQVEVTVNDDGIGIESAQKVNRIPGMNGGFGLFSVRSRAEELGGELHLRPRDGGGTSATLRLPRQCLAAGGCPLKDGEPSAR
jgi:two-component system sensor histidine kinase DegS